MCVVGDDDQCIFYSNGSFVENIMGFKDRYSNEYEVTDVSPPPRYQF